ncbi:MAG: hypothetical protein HQK50_17650 [Oligoflexia bacterium]|nr:hypothetical protein [Oligoflexia bacterium]
MNKKCAFIINLRSGNSHDKKELRALKIFFQSKVAESEFIITESREDGINAIQRLVEKGVTQIVPIGGDGTFNSVVNGLLKTKHSNGQKVLLSCGRWGTGQDYFKTLIYPYKKYDWRELVYNYQIKHVDAAEMVYKVAEGESRKHYFVNMSSAAMTAEIISLREHSAKWMPSKLQYIYPTIKTLLEYPPQQVELTVDGVKKNVNIMTITVAKGRFAGGGMKFAEKIELNDGLFEITIFLAMKPAKMLLNLSRLYSGNIENVCEVVKMWGKVVSIKSEKPIPLEFDGEFAGYSSDVTFATISKALKVCCPPS